MNKENITVEKIPVEKIFPDENQPRKTFDLDELASLAESIEKHGLLQPIIVRPQDDRYIIVAGERRFRAVKFLRKTHIDAIIKNTASFRELSLIENIQRENLNSIEEAHALNDLAEENGYTHEELSMLLGKSRSYISNKLRLLKLDSRSQKLLASGQITEGHARVLLQEKSRGKRQRIAKKILTEGLNVRTAEKKLKKDKNQISEYQNFEELLEDFLSTKVSINSEDSSGQITIDFYSTDQLKEILDKICNS